MMLKNRIKHYIGRYPSLFMNLYRTFAPQKNQKLLFGHDTELVLEGYPRSANTFSVVAFEQAQSRPVKLAHHLHVEAQLIQAARENKPAVALLRNPEDCFRSLLVRHPETPVSWAINRYIQFYTAISKLGDKCLIITYEEVINDMGAVIEKINKHFGTNYDVPVHDQTMVQQVFSKVESINQQIDQGKESHVARPSKERKQQSQNIDFTGFENKIRQSKKLYEHLTSKL